MRSALFGMMALGLSAMACTQQTADGSSSPNELGLEVSALQDDLVVGSMTTQSGVVTFRAERQTDGVFKVTFDRGRGTFGTVVDWNKYEFDLVASDGMAITREDRFIMTALETTLDVQVGNKLQITDNLIRQARLWSAHPVAAAMVGHHQADTARGWTTLCKSDGCAPSGAYRYFYHDGSGVDFASCGYGNHDGTNKSNYLYYGAKQSTTGSQCRTRCGAGCDALWGSSAWTQDCGNHDICEWYHTSGCGDEFTSASDDYTFAGNCKNCG